MKIAENYALVSHWNYAKNSSLDPNELVVGSHKKVWWVCEKGHEWEATVKQTVKKDTYCSVCSGKIVSAGITDIRTTHPEITREWHPHKNTEISFTQVSKGSDKKVWWMCTKGHEWQAKVYSRCLDNNGCPYCAGQKIWAGFNDLKTLYPHLGLEWHPVRNANLLPEAISPGSSKRVWWLGKCGHEWEARIEDRSRSKNGCPICAGRRVVVGINDLTTLNPKLAQLWHPTKNTIDIKTVTHRAGNKVWWKCPQGHEWRQSIDTVSSGLSKFKTLGCPVCANRQIVLGFNDLETTHPILAKQWHPTKNKNLTSRQVTSGTNKKVWWLCQKGHEWETFITSRSLSGTNCPHCGSSMSKNEKEIADYLKNKKLELKIKDRTLIAPYELDILIPNKNVAIEYNGLYWHTEERGKHQTYHHNKWKACKEKGVQLIQVWEDDWNRNPELVKRMLAYKLGVSFERKVFARNTIARLLTQDEVNSFLNEYHIQGAVDGGIRVGLFENIIVHKPFQEKPVAVMVLKREPGEGNTLNLLRYATSVSVVGGFTKLLTHVEQTYLPESIVTFSDNTVSDGGLYENNGFKAVRELKPDYMYVVKGERVHKFNYRLKRFREDAELIFEKGLSERELALLNNIPRIWDAGKVKWLRVVGG